MLVIDISSNKINDHDATIIVAALAKINTLRSLDMNCNFSMKQSGVNILRRDFSGDKPSSNSVTSFNHTCGIESPWFDEMHYEHEPNIYRR